MPSLPIVLHFSEVVLLDVLELVSTTFEISLVLSFVVLTLLSVFLFFKHPLILPPLLFLFSLPTFPLKKSKQFVTPSRPINLWLNNLISQLRRRSSSRGTRRSRSSGTRSFHLRLRLRVFDDVIWFELGIVGELCSCLSSSVENRSFGDKVSFVLVVVSFVPLSSSRPRSCSRSSSSRSSTGRSTSTSRSASTETHEVSSKHVSSQVGLSRGN